LCNSRLFSIANMSNIKDLSAPDFDDEEEDILADIDADAIVKQHSAKADDLDILDEAENLVKKDDTKGVWKNGDLDMPLPKKGGVWEGSDDEDEAPKPKKGGVWEGSDDEDDNAGVWKNSDLDMPRKPKAVKKKAGVWEGSDDEDEAPKPKKKGGVWEGSDDEDDSAGVWKNSDLDMPRKPKAVKKKAGVWEGSDDEEDAGTQKKKLKKKKNKKKGVWEGSDDDDDEKFDDDEFHQGVSKDPSNRYHEEAMKNRMRGQAGRIQQSKQVLKENAISRFISDGLDSARMPASARIPGTQQFDGSAAHCIVCNARGVYQDPNWAMSPDRFEMSPDPEIAHLFYHVLSNQQDDYEAIKIIIQNEHAPVDAIDNNGNTPLLLAAKSGNKRLCKFLLRNGADIYHQNEAEQESVLHNCFWNGWDDLGMYLISKGADVLIVNSNDQNCFEGDGSSTTVPVHVQMALIAEAKEQLKSRTKNQKKGQAINLQPQPPQTTAPSTQPPAPQAGAGWNQTPQGQFGDEPEEERSFSL